ncbi:MAG TPA: erythromycin esterase family protein, partial [Allosphingosinicella sp.]
MDKGINRREAIGMAGAAALFGASPLAAQSSAELPFAAEALTWLRHNAQPLDGYDPPIDSLRPLVQALEGSQLIGLGEATLGSHEDQTLKAAIAKALIAHGGVRVLAIEGNRRPAGMIDDYVRGGGPDPIAAIRDGGLPQAWQSEPFIGLIGWIRGWNLAGRPAVRIVGIDVSSVGSDAWQAWRFFQVVAPRHVATFEDALAPLVGTPAARERSVFELARTLSQSQWNSARQALDQIRNIIVASNRPGSEDAAGAALAARRSMDVARAAGSEGSANAGGALRERMMADNLLEQAGRDRTMLWSHNVKVLLGGDGIGAHLRRRLARNYRAVTFEAERGAVRVKPAGGALP